jgi:hypothetical protein
MAKLDPFTVTGLATITITIRAATIDQALARWNRWADNHRVQRLGRAEVVIQQKPPGVVDPGGRVVSVSGPRVRGPDAPGAATRAPGRCEGPTC